MYTNHIKKIRQNVFYSYFNQPVTSFSSFSITDLRWPASKRENYRKFLKLHWSDFHLSSLSGVLISFPGAPDNTIPKHWWVVSVMIQTVQVGVMTVLVPPGSFIVHSAVTTLAVIILIFGGKGVTTMLRKRITSSSWKKKTRKFAHSHPIL